MASPGDKVNNETPVAETHEADLLVQVSAINTPPLTVSYFRDRYGARWLTGRYPRQRSLHLKPLCSSTEMMILERYMSHGLIVAKINLS